MGWTIETWIFLTGFAFIAIASNQVSQYFPRIKLPLITGFLFCGILAGPYALDLIPREAIRNLRMIDEISVAFIAFAAGSELYVEEFRSRLRSIKWISFAQVLSTFTLCSLAVFYLGSSVPFLKGVPSAILISVALLSGSILIARSPSSAIAIINELRAKGPFTQTVLGVIVVSDVAVIVLFALSSSVADALLSNLGLNGRLLVLLVIELLLSLILGCLVGGLFHFLLGVRQIRKSYRTLIVLFTGYGVFLFTDWVTHFSASRLSFEISVEPLLICMIGSVLVANRSKYRAEFLKILHDAGPPIYVAFFTLTGASLAMDVLIQTWKIALILFGVRIVSLFVGSLVAGAVVGEPRRYQQYGWMAYVTQAGIGLGLAKEVSDHFPDWGGAFATLIISIIILNQLVGPPLFKWAFIRVGEAHPKAGTPHFDGVRDAIIFGLEDQSLLLARQLYDHGWEVKIASRKANQLPGLKATDVNIYPIQDLNLEALKSLEAGKADAIVTMLSDEENYKICELAYEHFGTASLVVRLGDRKNAERFHQLGALIVDPSTAIVSLLYYFVRSPSAVSLILGLSKDQDVVDLEVRNPDVHRVLLRDLRLPLDTLILAVRRRGRQLVSHGYTRLELGDRITVVGSAASLKEVTRRIS
jgi:Trk K+ transport system NAD-binding subunit/Kef-type K+ transport system membrane component KefB